MGKKNEKEIWQKNNPKIQLLLSEYIKEQSMCPSGEKAQKEKGEKLLALRVKLNEENMKSQLMWITLRSCKGIPCKKCYLNQVCTTYEVKDSQKLAADIIKQKLGVKNEGKNN